jgi:hypothetical protein
MQCLQEERSYTTKNSWAEMKMRTRNTLT